MDAIAILIFIIAVLILAVAIFARVRAGKMPIGDTRPIYVQPARKPTAPSQPPSRDEAKKRELPKADNLPLPSEERELLEDWDADGGQPQAGGLPPRQSPSPEQNQPEPAAPPANAISRAADAMEKGEYDQAVALLRQAKDSGYKSPYLDLDVVLSEAEAALQRQLAEQEDEQTTAAEAPADDDETTDAPRSGSFVAPSLPPQSPAPAPPPASSTSSTPDFDNMSPDEIRRWMENLINRQGAEGIFQSEKSMNAPGSAARGLEPQPVQFSAYYPKEIEPEQWQPIHAYIFRESAAAAVKDDAGKQLGSQLSGFRSLTKAASRSLEEGAFVTATPHIPGFQFNPPSVSLGFYKDWHRFDFELRAMDTPLNQSVNGLMTFTVEGIIVADIPLSIYVGEGVAAVAPITATTKLYQSIFCSYSHADTQIVKRAESVCKALGMDFLRDVITLKSGQHWSDELLNMISEADIFQLFWSSSAADSQYVRQEWERALNYQDAKPNFIRPVYWQQPIPPVPAALSAIHFAYQPDLDD
jgi:hypothetical protein